MSCPGGRVAGAGTVSSRPTRPAESRQGVWPEANEETKGRKKEGMKGLIYKERRNEQKDEGSERLLEAVGCCDKLQKVDVFMLVLCVRCGGRECAGCAVAAVLRASCCVLLA